VTTDLDTLLIALYVLVDDHVIDSGPRPRLIEAEAEQTPETTCRKYEAGKSSIW
jgi:hypothetical protein